MLNSITSHLQGSSNLDTSIIVLVYSVAIMFVAVAFHNIARAFFPATVVHNHKEY